MVVGGVAAAGLLPRFAVSGADSVREIHLVVRDMTYYVDGAAEANPTLHLRRGERVRVVLRNEDVGMTHDFTVPAWKAATRTLAGRGEAALEFRAPAVSGDQEYVCTPHGQMMRGTIRVE